MKQRNISIDILKGIGIILVLVAHSLGGYISKFAYTFHMPLFFILTGLFISEVKNVNFATYFGKAIRKDFRRLIIPALFTIAIILAISCLYYVLPGSYLQSPISLIWNDDPEKPLSYVNSLGNLWFLFALFWGKLFFYVIRQFTTSISFPICSLILGFMAVYIGSSIAIPFELLVGLSVVPFIWIGYCLKHHGGVESGIKKYFYLTIPLWIVYIFYGHLQVGRMEYDWYYVPDIFAACGGTLFFYKVSNIIELRTKHTSRFLAFLGTYSLILICAPTLETYCFPMQEVIPSSIPMRPLFVIGGKVGWCALSLYACLKIPFLKKIFGVK